ncbi:MAG: Xaa-Pro dipeptidase [Oscillospiraceae bacterium]
MYADCHIHMVLDGVYYKDAIAAHRDGPREDLIHLRLETYRSLGFTYLRDGGDRWGVGQRARALAGAYGITYRTPLFPIYKRGHYGGFIGRGFDTMEEYRALVQEVRQGGGDFVKIMISGLMDFDRFGVLTSAPLEDWEIREMIRIAHEAGFAVMAHANGAQTVLAAAEAGVDSVEHGAYLSTQALEAMAAAGTVWVPTLSTIGNLRGTGRFSESDVEQILASAQARVAQFHAMGGYLAPGSDAGAYAVFHGAGGLDEFRLLSEALGPAAEAALDRGISAIRQRF